MKLQKSEILLLIIVLISFAVATYVYPHLPAQVASHWNIYGQVDGYLSQFWGAFLLPFMLLGLLVVFLIVPRIDPQRNNIEKFRGYFNNFVILLFLFLSYIYALTLAWNLGYSFDLITFLIPATAVLFFYIGILVSHAEPNWSIGIRTPWTLSNNEVWKRTHALGGKLFKASALISLLGLLFPLWAVWFILVPTIGTAVFTIIYSFVIYRQIKEATPKISNEQ